MAEVKRKPIKRALKIAAPEFVPMRPRPAPALPVVNSAPRAHPPPYSRKGPNRAAANIPTPQKSVVKSVPRYPPAGPEKAAPKPGKRWIKDPSEVRSHRSPPPRRGYADRKPMAAPAKPPAPVKEPTPTPPPPSPPSDSQRAPVTAQGVTHFVPLEEAKRSAVPVTMNGGKKMLLLRRNP